MNWLSTPHMLYMTQYTELRSKERGINSRERGRMRERHIEREREREREQGTDREGGRREITGAHCIKITSDDNFAMNIYHGNVFTQQLIKSLYPLKLPSMGSYMQQGPVISPLPLSLSVTCSLSLLLYLSLSLSIPLSLSLSPSLCLFIPLSLLRNSVYWVLYNIWGVNRQSICRFVLASIKIWHLTFDTYLCSPSQKSNTDDPPQTRHLSVGRPAWRTTWCERGGPASGQRCRCLWSWSRSPDACRYSWCGSLVRRIRWCAGGVPQGGPWMSSCRIWTELKINFSTGNAIALWKKRCGKDQKQLIM